MPYPSKTPSFLLLFLVVIYVEVCSLQAEDKVRENSIRPVQEDLQSNPFDPTLYITPKTAIRNFKKTPSLTILVDVRQKSHFQKARIPGAINIALYQIKIKSFLKQKPILLINEGYGCLEMQRTCSALNKTGYQAKVLFGGIKLWREFGGPVTGDYFYLESLKHISPNQYYPSSKLGNWVVIDTSKESSGYISTLLPQAIHVPYLDETNAFLEALRNLPDYGKWNRFSSTLVFNRDGQQYARMAQAIASTRLSNVLFLQGGLDGYQQFLNELAVMQQHERGTKVSQRRCGTCP